MKPDPSDWGGLKAHWQTGGETALTVRVGASLLWRIWLARAWFVSEVLSFLLLALIIVQKIAVAQYAGAVGLTLLGGLCAAGMWWARSARLLGSMGSLRGMVELTLSRARRTLRMVYGSYVVLAILFTWVLVGSHAVADDELRLTRLAWLGSSLLVTGVIHVLTRARQRRFTAIRASMFGSEP